HEDGRGQAPSFGGVAETFVARNRGARVRYGYLIQFVAAQLRGSTKRTHRASVGAMANGAFCKLRGLLIGDFAASNAQQGTAWAEHGRGHDGGLGSPRGVGGGSRGLSGLQAIELGEVMGREKGAMNCFDDDHETAAAWARWRFVARAGPGVIAVGVRGWRR